MKCLLVDDEPLALDILESYIKKMPDLELIGKCSNALEASEFLKNNKISHKNVPFFMNGLSYSF